MPAEKMKYSFPQNPSSQELVNERGDFNDIEFECLGRVKKEETRIGIRHITPSQWKCVYILFFVNLINYMDRLTIAGILDKIKVEYKIGDSECGALQTAFVISYMIFAPLFGYIGDRHSRKLIMAIGVFIWAVFTLIGSFMPDYYTFLACRSMVGIGEASYSTIAPTIISDIFVKENRSKMLAFFYFAIPVGSGLGYIIGAEMTNLADGNWRWGLRVTPVLGLIAVIMILFLLSDPSRGESEGRGNRLKASTYTEDIRDLMNNKSFIFSTAAFTCVTFCTGALSWWGPIFIKNALKTLPSEEQSIEIESISFIFGAITMVSGIVGVPLGSIISMKLKPKYLSSDPIICAIGLMVSAVLLGFGMYTVEHNIYLTFILLFIGEVALNLNWSIVADILLYVVIPTRRSTAEAVQILISHAFGDAGSPYLIGLISDNLKSFFNSSHVNCNPLYNTNVTNVSTCYAKTEFYSMQYALFSNCGVEVLGGVLFLVTAVFVVADKLKCEKIIDESHDAWYLEDEEKFIQVKKDSALPINSKSKQRN